MFLFGSFFIVLIIRIFLFDICKQMFYNIRRIYKDWKWYYEKRAYKDTNESKR